MGGLRAREYSRTSHDDLQDELVTAQFMADTTQEEKLYSINDIRRLLPDFIDEEYPKEAKDGTRGPATLACTLLTIFLLKVAIKKENELTNTKT